MRRHMVLCSSVLRFRIRNKFMERLMANFAQLQVKVLVSETPGDERHLCWFHAWLWVRHAVPLHVNSTFHAFLPVTHQHLAAFWQYGSRSLSSTPGCGWSTTNFLIHIGKMQPNADEWREETHGRLSWHAEGPRDALTHLIVVRKS